ncbi:MAG TPA: hypothetical protein DEQ83_03340, partial [Rhodobiaceae bacterium]|nr:hypothetical protein [Rhodobiaceae bacterium]
LTGVFVVADSLPLPQKRHDKFVGKLIRRQLAQADLVLLSKTDLLPDDANAIYELVATLTEAPIMDTARLDGLSALLLTSAHGQTQSDQANQPNAPLPEMVNAGDVFDHVYFTRDAPLDVGVLENLLHSYAGKLVRAKGHTGTHRLQLVDRDWKLTPAAP